MVTSTRSLKQKTLLQLLLLVAVLVLLNLISGGMYFRLDFTQDKRYTPSRSTKNLLKDLPEVVTLNAYFSEDLPPELLPVRREFKEWLVEYENLSRGKLVYAIENPNKSQEEEQKAQREGIAPVTLNVRRRDQIKQMRVYMGITLYAGSKKEVIPYLRTDRSLEHALTMAIKKLTLSEKPKLGFIQGQDEPLLEDLEQLEEQLSMLYEIDTFSLAHTEEISDEYKALIWIGPTKTISPTDLDKLTEYLSAGGGLLLAYSPIDANLQNIASIEKATDIGITNWLQTLGVKLETDEVLIDAQCGAINVAQQMGGFTINQRMSFPYFPVVSSAPDHPISSDLEGILLQFTAPVSYVAQDTASQGSATPLLYSSKQTGLRPLPDYIDINKRWLPQDYIVGPQTLGLAVEGGSLSHPEAKMVLFSDHSFLIPPEQGQKMPEANITLAINSIDWIADDTGLIDLRSKGISVRPMDPIEDSTKTWLSYGNMGVPILMVLLYAFARSQYRLRKRQHWMENR